MVSMVGLSVSVVKIVISMLIVMGVLSVLKYGSWVKLR